MPVLQSNLLTNITPKDIDYIGGISSYSGLLFADNFYLIVIYYQAEQERDLRKILRYDRDASSWETIYVESLSKNKTRDETEQNRLKKSFKIADNDSLLENKAIIWQTAEDSQEILYVLLASPLGLQLLRSEDKEQFIEINSVTEEIAKLFSLRNLVSFQERFYALPKNLELNRENNLIFYCFDPVNSRQWQEINLPNSEQADNKAISEIVVFNDRLYAATMNSESGFQVWKTSQNTPGESLVWQSVLVSGAYKYVLNQQIFTMVAFQSALYIVAGVQISDDRVNNFELIRIYPDDDWDLIFGVPRFTPKGLKVPLSAIDPSLDNLNDSSFKCLFVRDDYLYLGTQNEDGLQLWTSEDGETWMAIPQFDLKDYYQVEVHTILSTSSATNLILNTTNLYQVESLQIWQIEHQFSDR